MTSRTARTLALGAGLAILVAACGSSAATTAPATQAPATQAPATLAPVGSGGVLPSFAIPSFHGDVDLENMIPDELGGEAVITQSMTGELFLGTANSEFTAVLSGLGKQASDLSVAFGITSKVSVIAFQIDGAPGSAILEAFKSASADVGTITDASYGGKSVKKVTPTVAATGISYIYTTQDVVFVVSGAALTDALLNEAFQKLP